MMITPDIALCDYCRKSITDVESSRFGYAFTTCNHCGPRYSILQKLPFKRENTSMQHFEQCDECLAEYNNINHKSYHNETNSCPNCAIKLHLYSKDLQEQNHTNEQLFSVISDLLAKGNIIAVKTAAQYLLVCDSTNKTVIKELRNRKNRSSKPFALLYADIEMLQADLSISPIELNALKDKSAPVVLCKTKQYPENNICVNEIAPDLQKIGAMLSATPLLHLIVHSFGKPLIATSANISDQPIVYQDNCAKELLQEMADYLLTYDREIIAAQSDSILEFSSRGQKIILRRARGMAPIYHPINFSITQDSVLALGSDISASFAIANNQEIFISHSLGNYDSIQSKEFFNNSLDHASKLLEFSPDFILTDLYSLDQVAQYGIELATKNNSKVIGIQQHEAHFAAVMAENKLLELKEPVLGIVWDENGYGNDGHIWGGEIFLYDEGKINRSVHLDYFPQLGGKKMDLEPRLSALSILKEFPLAKNLIKKHFTESEWVHYHELLSSKSIEQTSSMNRLIDAVACLLGLKPVTHFEGEAIFLLEALANKSPYLSYDSYHFPIVDGKMDWRPLMQELIQDRLQKEPNVVIAWKFFYSLAKVISRISSHFFIDKMTFSGTVFQNALLVDMVIELLSQKRQLYFHQQLSPNDECISFGQLAWYSRFA